MTLERQIRSIAGVFILASLALAQWVDARFLWLTAFVGATCFSPRLRIGA